MLVLWSVDVVVGFGLPLARVVFDFVGDVCGLFRGVDCGIVGDVPELAELAEFASMVFLDILTGTQRAVLWHLGSCAWLQILVAKARCGCT
jgi:hypothetical protein